VARLSSARTHVTVPNLRHALVEAPVEDLGLHLGGVDRLRDLLLGQAVETDEPNAARCDRPMPYSGCQG
jgi:hypothetical protein